MKMPLWISLFLSGVLLAACTRGNSPLVLAASAAERPAPVPAAFAPVPAAFAPVPAASVPDSSAAGTENGCYYLVWNGKNAFVLHYLDRATGRDTPVAAASGSPGAEGSRTVRFERQGRTMQARAEL